MTYHNKKTINRIPTKEDIKEIVDKSFYDLGYKKKFSKEYYEDLVNTTLDNISWDNELLLKSTDVDDVVDSEKCGKPDYIQSLPGDLRTNDKDVLQERLDAIDGEIDELDELIGSELWIQEDRQKDIDELTQENKDLTRIQEELVKDNKKINDNLDKVIGDALTDVSEIRDSWDDLQKRNDTNIEPSDRLNILVRTLSDTFEDNGLIYSDEVDSIKSIADDVEDYFSSVSDEVNDWQQEGMGLSDMIRDLADKYDVNKHPLGDSLEDFQVNYNFIMQHAQTKNENIKKINDDIMIIEDSKKIVSDHETVKQNYLDEKEKTQDKLNQL